MTCEQTYQILQNLCDPEHPEQKIYCEPRVPLFNERNLLEQYEGETVNDIRMKNKSIIRKFTTFLIKILKDKFISGL